MRSNIIRVIVVAVCVLFTAQLFSQSTVCNWKYRKRIAFNPAQVAGSNDLANYPALINITSDVDLRHTSSGGHVDNTNGFDIIFTADDGVTVLDHYLEKYTSTTGELVTWVRIPSLSTTYNTYIYMYYGNTAITTNQSSTNAWNSNYKGVYFFHSDYNDKTSNGNNGTNNSFASTTGTVANGISSNNVNDYVSIGTAGWSASTASYEMWVRSTGAWPATEAYFLGHTTLAAYNNRIQIYAYNGRLRVGLGNSHAIGGDLTGALTVNRWYHIAVLYSGGSHTVCVNGANVYTGTYAGLANIGQADIGNNGNDHTQAVTAGNLDQFMISNSNRGVDWITTSYNNQSSPSTFYSISTEPKVWTGVTNTNYNTATNWLNNSAPASGDDIIINSAANQPVLVTNEQIGSAWLRSGSSLSLANNSLSIRYDVTNCGTLSNNSGTVVCNSTSAYAQIQHFSGSGTFNLKSLHVNNTHASAPSLSLSADVTVNGTLQLSSGILYSSATNLLSLSNTAVSTSGLATSFVSGPMSKTGASDFVFPVGKGTKWRRCAVSNITVSDTYTAEYFDTPYSSTSPVNSPLNHVSYIEYWQVDRAGSGNANLTLYWEDASVSGITNCPDLTIARWNGASWDERAGTASGSCAGTGQGSVVTNAALTAFSPFTFAGHLSWAINPLPVTLLTFTATPINKNKVLIEWSTASEDGNDHFDIERTTDGSNFELVGKQNGKGNPHKKSEYSMYDKKPHKGVSYYRLKQVDVNGKETLSPLASVNINEDTEEGFTFSIYPNPNNGEFTMEGNIDGAQISIYNTLGQQVEFGVRSVNDTKHYLDCSKFAKGVYFINVKLNDEVKTQKLLIE